MVVSKHFKQGQSLLNIERRLLTIDNYIIEQADTIISDLKSVLISAFLKDKKSQVMLRDITKSMEHACFRVAADRLEQYGYHSTLSDKAISEMAKMLRKLSEYEALCFE